MRQIGATSSFRVICVNLRLVHVIVLEQPEVGGLETQLLLGPIKARENQKASSAVSHHVQSFLNIYDMRGFGLLTDHQKVAGISYKDSLLTCPDLNLRGKKFLEGGEDTTT